MISRLVGAGAPDDVELLIVDHHRLAGVSSWTFGCVDVKAAVEPVGPPHAAGAKPLHWRLRPQPSTMSTNTRRLSRLAAVLTTVRSAAAVRPPRPITLP